MTVDGLMCGCDTCTEFWWTLRDLGEDTDVAESSDAPLDEDSSPA